MVGFDFAGEAYLQEGLPDYASERQMLLVKLVISFVVWIIVIPSFLTTKSKVVPDFIPSEGGETTVTKSFSTGKTRTRVTTKIIKVQKATATKLSASKEDQKRTVSTKTTTPAVPVNGSAEVRDCETVKVIDWRVNMFCFLSCIFHLIYLMAKSSPDNYYTSRTVFESPLFTQKECDYLIDMAERVAGQNYQKAQEFVQAREEENNHESGREEVVYEKNMGYLDEPRGWQKSRHKQYPTTDLNLATDGFADQDREWIGKRLDARLSPTLEHTFGVPPSAVRANDMFLVRYDGDRQASLEKHTDDGSITFSVLLSDGFEGGGTLYWNRHIGAPFTYVLPKAGMMQTFPSLIQHEGVQTTKGRRYLLIGFLAVDKIDPWTHRPTGLSWFSSWGSFNWATKKFKDGVKAAWMVERGQNGGLMHSHEASQLFVFVHKFLLRISDEIFPHRFAVLVNETSADDYLRELDKAYGEKATLSSSSTDHRSSLWFAHQQVNVNIDGTFFSWKTDDRNDL